MGAAAAVVGVTTAAPALAAGGGKQFVFDVDTGGFADFQSPADPVGGTGPFFVSGVILYPGTEDPIGAFQCWGFISSAGLGVITQEFAIDGRGNIQVSGIESDVPRAVTGGTGDFAHARGEGFPDVAIFQFNDTGKFRIDFRLSGARGRGIPAPPRQPRR